jgi:putative aldouronate transport system permease protein
MVASSQITQTSDPKALEAALKMNSATLQSAQILLSLVPVIIVYPFVQRFFVKGLVVGSVKG